jgi:hypothetical protein
VQLLFLLFLKELADLLYIIITMKRSHLPRMIMATKTFTAGDFLKALAEGSLTEPIAREGVAKPDPTDQQAFLFSEGGSCGPWLKVPAEVVESVEFLRTVRCLDHDHPFVRLRFNDPPKENALATFFAALARRAAGPAPTLLFQVAFASTAQPQVFRAERAAALRPNVGAVTESPIRFLQRRPPYSLGCPSSIYGSTDHVTDRRYWPPSWVPPPLDFPPGTIRIQFGPYMGLSTWFALTEPGGVLYKLDWHSGWLEFAPNQVPARGVDCFQLATIAGRNWVLYRDGSEVYVADHNGIPWGIGVRADFVAGTIGGRDYLFMVDAGGQDVYQVTFNNPDHLLLGPNPIVYKGMLQGYSLPLAMGILLSDNGQPVLRVVEWWNYPFNLPPTPPIPANQPYLREFDGSSWRFVCSGQYANLTGC